MVNRISDPLVPKSSYSGMLTDSQQWRQYHPRLGDVVVATPPKSGTTWVQAILALLFSGDPMVAANPSTKAPWIDIKLNDMEEVARHLEAQSGRRHVKTHTPLDGIPIWDELRYITVYRHPIDVHFSARKHIANYSPEIAEELGVNYDNFPKDPRHSFRIFIEGEDLDHGSLKTIVNHYLQCLAMEPRENILRLHYANMKRNLGSHLDRVAKHIGVKHSPDIMKRLVDAATFENMKANADRFAPAAGEGLWRNDAGFFDSATNNKWEGVLTEDDLAIYDTAISKLLEPDQRYWLEWGSE